MRILHITAHMGGGAGNAISNIILEDREDSHRLICLQRSEKRQYVERCLQTGMDVWEAPDMETVTELLKWSDVVIMHWWHHPLMCGLLAYFPTDIPVRIILWTHISGCTYPMIQEQFALAFDRIFITTPFSFENSGWSEEGRKAIQKKSSVVYGIGQLAAETFRLKRHSQKDELVIGYVGTLGKAKLHPQYVAYCEEVIRQLPNCRFVMVGDVHEADWLLKEIEERNLAKYFQFTGYCTNVPEQLEKMDVFAYPLNPKHFGTTENVILEAMLSGLPVVLLNQNAEKYIVTHEENGILVQTKEEYAKAILELYNNPERRARIGEYARQYVMEQYDTRRNTAVFRKGVQKAMEGAKHSMSFMQICGTEPYEWLLYGMDKKTRDIFEESMGDGVIEQEKWKEYIVKGAEILKGQSKSSVSHFAAFYPEDKQLSKWKQLIEE